MSMQLVHVEQHPTNFSGSRSELEKISNWLNHKIRNDESLDAAVRAEPETVNLLHNILMDETGMTEYDGASTKQYIELLTRTADQAVTEGKHEMAAAVDMLAEELGVLIEERDMLVLALV